MDHKELLEKVRGDEMIHAIATLVNVAVFGSVPLYKDGTQTPNRLAQLSAAKFLHSLQNETDFDQEHEWLLNQIRLHPLYSERPKKNPENKVLKWPEL